MKKNNKILTIAIPTYNRADTICKSLDDILANNIIDKVEILIIDNNSEDQTYDLIKNKYDNKFDIKTNKTNIGFAKNTIKLFEHCKTKYLLWLSDEDFLISKNLNFLITFLKTNEIAMLSTQYFLQNKNILYRGKKNNSRIKENEIWESCSHLPGLVFNVELSKDVVQNYTKLSNRYKNLGKYYPQFFLLVQLMSSNKKGCFYFNYDICYEKNPETMTHDADAQGNLYHSISLRWEMHKESISYLKYITTKYDNEISWKILSFQKKRILKMFQFSIETEDPELKKDYENAINKHVLNKIIFFFIKIFYKPHKVFRALYNAIKK